MSTPKGYSSQEKEDRLSSQFSTVEPVRESQFGLSVQAHQFVYEVGTDAAEAGTTAAVIVATGHSAKRGDIIRLTSGPASGKEAKVWAVSANSIELAETLSVAPAAGNTFQILRNKYPLVDSSGAVITLASEVATAADGGPLPAVVKVVGGYDGAAVQVIKTDTAGYLQVDVLSSALPSGAATEAKQDTANGLLTTIDSDTSALAGCVAGSEVQVDVVSSALPTGAATASNQTDGSQKTKLVDSSGDVADVVLLSTGLAGTDKGLVTNTVIHGESSGGGGGYVDVKVTPSGAMVTEASLASIADVDGQKTMAASLPVVIASDQSAIPVTDAGGSLTVDGTVAATQSGAWSVSVSNFPATQNVAVTSSVEVEVKNDSGNPVPISAASLPLPTGAATEATLSSLNGKVTACDTGAVTVSSSALPTGAATEATLSSLNGKVTACNTGAVTISSALPAGTNTIGKVDVNTLSPVDIARIDYTGTNVTTAAYTQLKASLAAAVKEVEIFDSSGQTLLFAVGGAGSEIDKFYIIPGGNGRFPITIPASSRVAIKAVSATANSGEIAVNFLG